MYLKEFIMNILPVKNWCMKFENDINDNVSSCRREIILPLAEIFEIFFVEFLIILMVGRRSCQRAASLFDV